MTASGPCKGIVRNYNDQQHIIPSLNASSVESRQAGSAIFISYQLGKTKKEQRQISHYVDEGNSVEN